GEASRADCERFIIGDDGRQREIRTGSEKLLPPSDEAVNFQHGDSPVSSHNRPTMPLSFTAISGTLPFSTITRGMDQRMPLSRVDEIESSQPSSCMLPQTRYTAPFARFTSIAGIAPRQERMGPNSALFSIVCPPSLVPNTST